MMRLKVTIVDNSKIEKIVNKTSHVGVCDKLHHKKEENYNKFEPSLEPVQEDEDIIFRPTAIVEENLEGNSTFGFSTPKKSNTLLEKVQSVNKQAPHFNNGILSSPHTPKTPRTSLQKCQTPKTPKSILKKVGTPGSGSKVRYTSDTPTQKKHESLKKAEEPQTPYGLRRRVKQRIQKLSSVLECLSSSSEEDFDDSDLDDNFMPNSVADENENSSSDCELDINDNNHTPIKGFNRLTKATPKRTPHRHHFREKSNVELAGNSDSYFVHNENTGCVATSDHTLGRLETPRLAPEALQAILKTTQCTHTTHKREILEDLSYCFAHWMTLLCEDFSIFLYGVGSKKELLSNFQKEYLMEIDHLVINGFFPSLTIKSILGSIIEEILEFEFTTQVVSDQLQFISNHYSSESCDPLFLVLHNIDGAALRSASAQSVLVTLAALKHVHLIASVDHINAPLIFDVSKLSSYKILWWNATTLASYTEETSYENSLLVQQSTTLALSSLIHVFKSLTPNAKGIFMILAKYQLEQKNDSTYEGLPFGTLYQRCRAAFLVNSDLTLRAQLTEFHDHKLIKFKKTLDASENLIIPLDDVTLREFTDNE